MMLMMQCASPLPDLTDFPCRDHAACGDTLRCISGFCRPADWTPPVETPVEPPSETPVEPPSETPVETVGDSEPIREAEPQAPEESPTLHEPESQEEPALPEQASDDRDASEGGDASEPVTEEPSVEEPGQEPGIEGTEQEPVAEKLVVEEVVSEKLSSEEPVTEALPEEPVAEKLPEQEPVVEQPTPEEPISTPEEPVSTPEEPVTEPPICLVGAKRLCYTGKTGCTDNGQGGYGCLGECSTGLETCTPSGWGPCVGDVTPTTEVCDGKDNDCNGKLDDVADLGKACQEPSRLGVCTDGVFACENNKLVCKQTVQLSQEVCDNKDNDCNGLIDENLTQNCTTACGTGTQTCKAGQWSVCSAALPQLEVCDGKDNDCDGLVDEGVAGCVTVFAKYTGRDLRGLAVNSLGDLYASDEKQFQIVKFDAQGNLSVFAGDGTSGYQDGAGAQARFALPRGLAFDRLDNLYVADVTNRYIRKITRQGQVSTVAGMGIYATLDGAAKLSQFKQIAGLAADIHGNIFMAELDSHLIRVLTGQGYVMTLAGGSTSGYLDGTGLKALFNTPTGLVAGRKGHLYIADYVNHVIRKLDSQGQVSTFAGSGLSGSLDDSDPLNASFNSPSAIATDIHGHLYVADSGNKKVRRIVPNGSVTTFAGGGSGGSNIASQFKFSEVLNLATSTQGYLYILDSLANTIYRMDLYGEMQPTSCPSEGLKRSCYSGPAGTDKNSPCQAGTQTCQNGNWTRCENQVLPTIEDCNQIDDDCDGQIDNNLSTPFCHKQQGVCVGSRVSICLSGGSWGACTDAYFATYSSIYGTDNTCDQIDNDCNGLLDDTAKQCTTTYAGTEQFGTLNSFRTLAQFFRPTDIASDSSGNLYIADLANHRIRKIDLSGNVTTVAGSIQGFSDGTIADALFNGPRSVAVDSQGNIYVSDTENHRIRKIDTQGNVSTLAGSGVSGHKNDTGTLAQFDRPAKILLDGQGNLYVADQNNHRIRIVSLATGKVDDYAGTGVPGTQVGRRLIDAQFNTPLGMALDAAGNLYVSDTGNHRICVVTKSTGVVTLLVGIGQGSQDGGYTQAQFSTPGAIFFVSTTELCVMDSGNRSVRKIDLTKQQVFTVIGNNGTTIYQVGPSAKTQLVRPVGGILLGNGDLLIVDRDADRIVRLVP